MEIIEHRIVTKQNSDKTLTEDRLLVGIFKTNLKFDDRFQH